VNPWFNRLTDFQYSLWRPNQLAYAFSCALCLYLLYLSFCSPAPPNTHTRTHKNTHTELHARTHKYTQIYTNIHAHPLLAYTHTGSHIPAFNPHNTHLYTLVHCTGSWHAREAAKSRDLEPGSTDTHRQALQTHTHFMSAMIESNSLFVGVL